MKTWKAYLTKLTPANCAGSLSKQAERAADHYQRQAYLTGQPVQVHVFPCNSGYTTEFRHILELQLKPPTFEFVEVDPSDWKK